MQTEVGPPTESARRDAFRAPLATGVVGCGARLAARHAVLRSAHLWPPRWWVAVRGWRPGVRRRATGSPERCQSRSIWFVQSFPHHALTVRELPWTTSKSTSPTPFDASTAVCRGTRSSMQASPLARSSVASHPGCSCPSAGGCIGRSQLETRSRLASGPDIWRSRAPWSATEAQPRGSDLPNHPTARSCPSRCRLDMPPLDAWSIVDGSTWPSEPSPSMACAWSGPRSRSSSWPPTCRTRLSPCWSTATSEAVALGSIG